MKRSNIMKFTTMEKLQLKLLKKEFILCSCAF